MNPWLVMYAGTSVACGAAAIQSAGRMTLRAIVRSQMLIYAGLTLADAITYSLR